MIASEPRLLLIKNEPKLAGRLQFLLDLFPALRRGEAARLCKAASLLLHSSDVLEERVMGIEKLLPQDVDVQV